MRPAHSFHLLVLALMLTGATAAVHAADNDSDTSNATTADTAASARDPLRLTTGNVVLGGSPVPAMDAPAAEPVRTEAPRRQDQQVLAESDVFGANLFTGSFARQGATQFNPDYQIAVGDKLQIRLWGGYQFDGQVTVDAQGNVFLPHVGPVRVLGVSNQELQAVVDRAIGRVFRANVSSYASLAAAQPVRIFVSGFVQRPGLYNGTSLDSLLHYLDQAGGIDPERGSFLAVQVKRGDQVRATFNLYDFLLNGRLPQIQLSDGDVIFVTPRRQQVRVSGLVRNAKRFEFNRDTLSLKSLIVLARPQADATHVRVVRNSGTVRNTEYFALDDTLQIDIGNGDEVEFTADKRPGTITVRVEGEHLSAQEYVLPYGARYGDLMQQVQLGEHADVANVQLFRASVKERQRQLLAVALKNFESSVLTARSATSDEARLRKEEADLLLQWVERARSIEPTGQVVIAGSNDLARFLLENGDIVRIPKQDNLVVLNGEVLFPTSVAWEKGLRAKHYIAQAGGYSQKADSSRVVVARVNGRVDQGSRQKVLPGDQILVLPKVDTKSLQLGKDLMQILFQLAVTARVALDL